MRHISLVWVAISLTTPAYAGNQVFQDTNALYGSMSAKQKAVVVDPNLLNIDQFDKSQDVIGIHPEKEKTRQIENAEITPLPKE